VKGEDHLMKKIIENKMMSVSYFFCLIMFLISIPCASGWNDGAYSSFRTEALFISGLSLDEHADDDAVSELTYPEELSEDPSEIRPSFIEKYEELADDIHEDVTRHILTSAKWLDSFFSTKRGEIEENKTNMKLSLFALYESDDGLELYPRARLRIVLPQFEDRLHLMIVGDSDDEYEKDYKKIRSQIKEEKTRDVITSIRYFIRSTAKKNVSIKAGLRFHDLKPIMLLEPRYSTERPFDPWVLRFTHSFKWYSDTGFEAWTRFDYERDIPYKQLFFRTSAEGVWYEDETGYYYNLRCALYQPLDLKRGLEYQWINYFSTSPDHQLDEIFFSCRYRQNVWRDWVFFQIEPWIAFRDEDHFSMTHGILMGIEAVFGKIR
jgi:hypothetical protein